MTSSGIGPHYDYDLEAPGRSAASEKTLVCLLASTRAHQLTFTSIKGHVLDELNADLALMLLTDDTYDYDNPFWQQAKYRWTAPIRDDYGEAYDEVLGLLPNNRDVASPGWRRLLDIKGIWLGGIKSPHPQASASAILPFCRWLLLRHLSQEGILDRYDRFVITRSDFMWLCPHPPLSILDRNAIWVPEGENWGGLNDRHLVVSRTHVANCLNMIEDLLLHPDELYEEMKHESYWNDEKFLAHHLNRKALLKIVKSFPYVMYTARPKYDSGPTWRFGDYEPVVGHFVKYRHEYRMASAYASVIRSREDWERKDWEGIDPQSLPAPSVSLPRKLQYAWIRAYFRCLDAWCRPDRVGRVVRRLAKYTAGFRVS